MMHQALIFSSMLATGVALFGTAAYVQADRNAFTDPFGEEALPGVRTTVSSLKPEEAPRVEAASQPEILQLPPIEIIGRRQIVAASTPKVSEPLAVEPCSPWEEIGPERVKDGNAIGLRRVRTLCAGNAASPR
jgi:hypothetical protein